MNNKKYIILSILLIGIIIFMIVYRVNKGINDDPENKNITKAEVARCISLLFHSEKDINNLKEDYFNNSSKKWYVPYMNMMYKDGYFLTKDILPSDNRALSTFTYGELDKLFTNMGIVDKLLLSYVNNNSHSERINSSEWSKIYVNLIKLLDKNKEISIKNINIIGDNSVIKTLKEEDLITSDGKYKKKGMETSYYMDSNVKAVTKDNELIWIIKLNDRKIKCPNTFVISIQNGIIKAFIDGAIREFNIKDKDLTLSGVIADLRIENGELKNYKIKEKSISGKVLLSGKDLIELDNQGDFKLSKDLKIYKGYGTLQMKSIKDIIVGYDSQRFIIEDGKIVAIIIDRDMTWKNIRVLIKDNEFKNLLHDNVTISTDSLVELEYGGKKEILEGGIKLDFNALSPYLKDGRLTITPQSVNGRINIDSIKRAYGTPSYRGTIEISKSNDKLIIVNELSVEEYLYSVVPSEMPFTYSKEALKAQAVCARSYAYKEISDNKYSYLGAHVDDSTSFQVYNNNEEKANTTEAVLDTYGEVIKYKDLIIDAYFFSTSCGVTTTALVWGDENPPYINSRFLTKDNTNIDLKDEKNFDIFIRNVFSSYDSKYSWYRWSIDMPLKDMTVSVNERISMLYKENPENVLTLKGKEYISEEISSIGEVKKIEIGERAEGGVLKYITVYGTEKTVRIYKEYYIRRLFYPQTTEFIKADDSKSSIFSMLPSAYFVMDPIAANGILTGYKIIGGGYGHGVGLSQNGANTMANDGISYKDIIKFFYKDVKVEKLY